MKKILVLLFMALFICSTAFAAYDVRVVDRDGNVLDVKADGSTNVGTVDTVTTVDTVSDATVTATVHPAGNSTLTSGYRDVATAGTAIAASGSVVINRVIVKASLTNTGNIYVGGSDVSTTSGVPLDAGEVWIGTVDNLTDIWINATVSGDSVGFAYETE